MSSPGADRFELELHKMQCGLNYRTTARKEGHVTGNVFLAGERKASRDLTPINIVDRPQRHPLPSPVARSMAKKSKPGRFTEAELELMKILWECGPSTVQGVVDHLPPGRPLAYTTVQTVLNVLHRKGSVRRKLRDRAYHYEAAVSRFDAASNALHDLVHKLFGASAISSGPRVSSRSC